MDEHPRHAFQACSNDVIYVGASVFLQVNARALAQASGVSGQCGRCGESCSSDTCFTFGLPLPIHVWYCKMSCRSCRDVVACVELASQCDQESAKTTHV